MADPDPELARVRRLARVLDDYYVDPLLGFVLPGIGDLAGSLVGLYTILIAIRRRVSPVIIARMLIHLAVDAALGVIPIVGDVFDIGHKATTKNLALLTRRVEAGGRATARDWVAVVGAVLAFVAAAGLAIYAVVAVVRAIV